MRRMTCLAAALLVVGGCSKDPARPEPPSERLGTQITPPNAVQAGGILLWSTRTNELVCVAAAGSNDELALLAIHGVSGATRTLDPAPSIPITLAHDGSTIFYNAIAGSPDSIHARYLTLVPGSAPRTLAGCEFPCGYLIEPAPDGDQLAVGTLGDSLAIYRLTTGERTPVTTGLPIAFSPNSDRLLFNGVFEPLTDARVLTIASGVTQPAALGLPDPIGASRVHWGVQGLEILYVSADPKLLYLRRVGPATTTLIWTSPDTLDGVSMAWSASGRRAAVWSSRLVGGGSAPVRRFELYAVDLITPSAKLIAFAQRPVTALLLSKGLPIGGAVEFGAGMLGRVAFSPNETEVAYNFGGGLYRSPFN